VAKKDPAVEEPEAETLRDAIDKAYDDVMGKGEDDGEKGGSSELEDGGLHDDDGRELEDEDERSGESTGAETELGGEEEEGGIDESSVEDEDDDDEDSSDEASDDEEGEDEEEDEEGREEGEVDDLDVGEIEPPDFWPDDVKAEFSRMPPKAQEYYVNSFKGMQADYTTKMQGIAEVQKAIDPVREELVSTGVSEGEMIRRFVAVHKKLESDPAGAIEWIAELYGVDVKTPKAETTELETPRVDALEEKMSAREQRDAIAKAHAVNDEVVKLRGEGKMPLYEQAEPIMMQLVQRAQALREPLPSVMELYDQAIYGNKSLREKHLAQGDLDVKKRRIAEKKKNLAKSKRAAGKSKSSKPTATREKRKPLTLKEELSMRYDQAKL
jgi:hypothetical protein